MRVIHLRGGVFLTGTVSALMAVTVVGCGSEPSATVTPSLPSAGVVATEPQPSVESSVATEPPPSVESSAAVLPTSQELCNMLSPADIDAAFAWAGFSVDPSRITVGENDYPSCEFKPTESDFAAPVSSLSLQAYPLGYQFGGQHRSELPAVWAQQDSYRGERMINGVPVHFVNELWIWAFMPDYTLSISGFGTIRPEFSAALESLLTPLVHP